MGLSTVYSIISAMNGIVDFTTCVGEGTNFTILLPESEQPDINPSKQEHPQNQYYTKSDFHILWVDDNEMVLNVAIEMVKTLGFKATAARSGKDALALIEANPNSFDTIFLDVDMPEKNGWETYKELRKTEKKLPVVICTGKGYGYEAEKIMQNGAYTLLQKPFTATSLRNLLQEILRLNLPRR